ncbi:MAG: hypothetical protein AAGE94_14315 [Acidobacteriota bacterium]
MIANYRSLLLSLALIAVVGSMMPSLATAQSIDPEVENRQIADIFDRALDAEARDSAWADSTEAMSRKAVIGTAGQAMVWVDTLCATTFCRSTLELETPGDESAIDDLVFVAPFDHGGWIRIHPDGRTVSLYFTRDGFGLPSLTPNG